MCQISKYTCSSQYQNSSNTRLKTTVSVTKEANSDLTQLKAILIHGRAQLSIGVKSDTARAENFRIVDIAINALFLLF